MPRSCSRALLLMPLFLSAGGCADGTGARRRPEPSALVALTSLPGAVTVGDVVGPIVVRVDDSDGSPVAGVPVTFAISRGGGRLSRTTDTTASDGTASVTYTVGTLRATNEVEAIVPGVAPLRFVFVASEGPSATLVLNLHDVRMPAGTDVVFASAVPRDVYGNSTNAAITWTGRDSTLVEASMTPNNNVRIQALRRPGQTYLVGTSGAATDSILVTVQAPGSPCALVAAPQVLAIGQVTQLSAGAACIRADDPAAEFALIAHYNTIVTTTAAAFTALGTGVTQPDTAFKGTAVASSAVVENVAFERDLRARESASIGSWIEGARAWRTSQPQALRGAVLEGQTVDVNVNAFDFCASPRRRSARVVAVTNGTIVLADDSNPAGGFTDAEYRAFGEMMDTLVVPLDTTNFGSPGHAVGDGRTVILFTRAVNELTATGSPNGVVLGFFYMRDLLPQQSPAGECPGSNAAEMFYMLVPDPTGSINGNVRDKAFVQNVTPSTIAHEFQHLINASRRMYVNNAPHVDEEPWLNEGLSHIAEELLFYRQSGLAPRQNIDGSLMPAGSAVRVAIDADQINNFRRYREYLKNPEDFSPLSFNDRLETRGAAWSFLRYIADRTQATQTPFWRRLANATSTGTINLDEALAGSGFGTLGLLRDWSISIIGDDIIAGINPDYQQPSWNLPSAMAAAGVAFPLIPRILVDTRTLTIGLTGGGTSYMRFAVAQGAEALITVTGVNNRPLPIGLRLSVVRIK
jgi:hypothetical protein